MEKIKIEWDKEQKWEVKLLQDWAGERIKTLPEGWEPFGWAPGGGCLIRHPARRPREKLAAHYLEQSQRGLELTEKAVSQNNEIISLLKKIAGEKANSDSPDDDAPSK